MRFKLLCRNSVQINCRTKAVEVYNTLAFKRGGEKKRAVSCFEVLCAHLRVLRVSAVNVFEAITHRRDAEVAEITQSNAEIRGLQKGGCSRDWRIEVTSLNVKRRLLGDGFVCN